MKIMLEEFKYCCMVDQIPKPNNFINLERSYNLTAIFQVSSYNYASSVGDVECIMHLSRKWTKNYIAIGFLSNTGLDPL